MARRPSSRRLALGVACALFGSLAVVAPGLVAPAEATIYGGPECELPHVDIGATTSSDVAPTAVDDTASVSEGRGVDVDVLANDHDPDSDLQLVGTSQPAAGTACVTGDGHVYYYSLGAPDDGTDSFSYSISDGDYYRTATVTVSVTPTAVAPPVVTTTRRTSSSGAVTRAAAVTVTNPDAEHTIVFSAGAVGSSERTVRRRLPAGGSTVVSTSRGRLAYETEALGGLGSQQDYVPLQHGVIDTSSGAVTATADPVDTSVPNDDLDLSPCTGFVESAGGSSTSAPAPVDDSVAVPTGLGRHLDVLANDPAGLTVVAAGPAGHGLACAAGDDVYYLNNGGTSDTFDYVVTDGDRVRAASVDVDVRPVVTAAPRVTRTLRTSSGRVTRTAQVTVTNPDPDHRIVVRAGPQPGPWTVTRTVDPGGRTVVTTSRSRLYYAVSAIIGDRYGVDEQPVGSGTVTTKTGKVTPTS